MHKKGFSYPNLSIVQTESTSRSPKVNLGVSFSKAKRFDRDHSYKNLGPGLYNTENSMISSHLGTKIGLGNKSPVILPHLLENPGPGSYESVDLNNLKTTIIRGVKFSRSQHSNFEEIIKASFSPPPGSYENNISFFQKKKRKKGTFSQADRYNYLKENSPSLGPGTYEVTEDFILPKKMKIGTKLGNSRAEELKMRLKKKLPGPGSYDVREIIETKKFVFGKGKRPDIFIAKTLSPGPGAYNVLK